MRRVSRCRNCVRPAGFGMVGSSEALASKVRITDGAFVDTAGEVKNGRYEALYNARPTVLEELASPKPGNMEFYFKRPGKC